MKHCNEDRYTTGLLYDCFMMVIYSTDPEMAITHSGLFWSMQDWSRMSAYLKSSSIHDLFHDAADGPAHRCVKKYI